MFWEGVISNNKCCKGVQWKEQNPPSSICFTKALWRCLQGAYSVGSIRPHGEEIIKRWQDRRVQWGPWEGHLTQIWRKAFHSDIILSRKYSSCWEIWEYVLGKKTSMYVLRPRSVKEHS